MKELTTVALTSLLVFFFFGEKCDEFFNLREKALFQEKNREHGSGVCYGTRTNVGCLRTPDLFQFDLKSDDHVVILGSDLGFVHDVICLCSYAYVCSVRKGFNSNIRDQYQFFSSIMKCHIYEML